MIDISINNYTGEQSGLETVFGKQVKTGDLSGRSPSNHEYVSNRRVCHLFLASKWSARIACRRICRRHFIRWEKPNPRAGNYAAAEKAWKHVIELDKTGDLASQAHFGLSGVYRKQGTEDAARKLMQFQDTLPARLTTII